MFEALADQKMNRLVIFVCAAIVAAEDICLPSTHTTLYRRHLDVVEYMPGHHRDEYEEGDFMKVWVSARDKKSLVHLYEDQYEHKIFEHHTRWILRDYNKGLMWRGDWDLRSRTVSHCTMELYTKPFEQYCLAKGARKSPYGDGTLGESNPVEWYDWKYIDRFREVEEQINLCVEKGSLSKIVHEHTRGAFYNKTSDDFYRWYISREWYNMVETPIDSSIFAVPAGCPNMP